MNRLLKGLILVLLSLFCILPVHSFGNNYPLNTVEDFDREAEEVFLSFNYQNLFNRVVIALYEDGQFYLPVSEIFTALKIPHEVQLNPPVITGSYLNTDTGFALDFKKFTVQLDNKGNFTFDASSMQVGELDFYVTPEVLQTVFDLNFTIDFNNLLLQLETEKKLPVVAEFERAQQRDKQNRFTFQKDYYPLLFDRKRKVLSGGFLDYSLSANLNEDINIYTYNLNLGTEILGGDLQGSAFGTATSNTSNFITNNLRWRYVWRDNNKLSQLYVGQTTSDGLINRNFVGVRATNEPIEPRYIYDEFEIEGEALPGSEVELYFNDALYDYQEITQNGQYRFLAPLTYGSSRLRLRIYDPAGGVSEQASRIQVPFSYLPSGELNYHINAGRVDNPIFGSTQQSNILQGDIAYGLSNWLTQKVGVEYLDEFTDQTPLLYSSTSARLFKQYLIGFDATPSAFYRVSASAIYPSSASWDVEYSYYNDIGIYNILGNDHEVLGNVFLPFTFLDRPFNIRLLGNHSISPSTNRTRYSIDLNTRLDRLNLRFRYSDNQTGTFNLEPSLSSELNTSATYFVSRTSSVPRALQGMFVRGEMSYNPNLSELNQVDFQISRSIFENGRIQASASRNFLGDFNLFSLGFTIDFSGVRSTSTARSTRNGASFSQNFLGSIGLDDRNQKLLLTNRQQVGRSATSVRLFVDNNNSGFYDEGDDVINNNALRIGRSGITNMGGDGIIYITQLQSYNRINMEINRSAIENPLLIPELEQFSLVTDPNRYKPIGIPFYRSGIISGTVMNIQESTEKPQPGLRVYLTSEDESFQKELRTFNDGSFYAYEIPPGNYNLYIDKKQLEFLDSVSNPDTIKVTVEAKAEGDFVENLNFNIVSGGTRKVIPSEDNQITEKKDTNLISNSGVTKTDFKTGKKSILKIQLGSFSTAQKSNAVLKLAKKQFEGANITFNTNTNMFSIRSDSLKNSDDIAGAVKDSKNNYFTEPALLIAPSEPSAVNMDSLLYGNSKLNEIKNKIGNSNDLVVENINFTYLLQVHKVTNSEMANGYIKLVKDNLNTLDISFSAKEELITLRGFKKWSNVILLKNKLNEARLGGEAIPVLDITH